MSIQMQENVSLRPYTVFKIGGTAKFFAAVRSKEELQEALEAANERRVPFFIGGAGSNILVSDAGLNGLYIKNGANGITADGERIYAESGAMMAAVAARAGEAGLSGFEWGIGIPGTVGGSVRGNAGCFGGEMKDAVDSVAVFDTDKAARDTRDAKSCEFGYRDSLFKKNPSLVVLGVTLALARDDPAAVRARMRAYAEKRSETQDIGAKCAGCIFKNIPWDRRDIQKEKLIARFPILGKFAELPAISAGFLIDEAGLKGRRIGGAEISRKHANFFVNMDGARAEDVVMLIALAKEYVHRKFGILLEEEIQYVGF